MPLVGCPRDALPLLLPLSHCKCEKDFGRCGDTTRAGLAWSSAQMSRARGVTKPLVVSRVSLRHLLGESLHLLWLCVLTMLTGP